jgi:transposase
MADGDVYDDEGYNELKKAIKEMKEKEKAKGNKMAHLSNKQQMAIDLILMGKVDREVAEIVKVSRSTINDWKNTNEVFKNELNKRKFEISQANKERLNSIYKKALETVEKAIVDNEDVKTALEIIKLYHTPIYQKDNEVKAPNDVDKFYEMLREYWND